MGDRSLDARDERCTFGAPKDASAKERRTRISIEGDAAGSTCCPHGAAGLSQ